MKRILYFFIILFLLFPAIQKKYQLFNSPSLNGSFYLAENTKFSIHNWFNNEFQDKEEKYIKDHIGFRNSLVMLNNQTSYSLYKLAQTPNSVIGKDGYLYINSYIYNYTGENYIGNKRIKEVSSKIKFLQEYLETKNITLLTAFNPSKASFYSKFIPNRFKSFPITNQKAYMQTFDSLNINYIDINAYFLDIQDTIQHPLFPKNGLHWTSYGMALSMDTLIKAIGKYRNCSLQDLTWKKKIVRDSNNHLPDYDAENLLNLFFDIEREAMPYPEFTYSNDTTYYKPKTLFITDSYYWQAYSQYIPHNIFDWGGFWYYFKTLRFNDGENEQKIDAENIDIRKQLIKQDVIVLFASQATLHLFTYGFEEEGYNELIFHDHNATIKHFIQQIDSDTNWKKAIKEKAITNNLSYTTQLEQDAIFTAKKFLEQNFPNELIKFNLYESILNKPKWVEEINSKALKNNLSFEEQITIDINWITKENK